MKVRVATLEKESFVSGLALIFDEGLILRTHEDLCWCGKEKKNEIVKQFKELIETLKDKGFQVENEHKLPEIKLWHFLV